MLYNLLADTNPFREASIGEAALYALLGYLIVFLGITFLIFVVWGIGKLMAIVNGKSFTLKRKKPEKVEKTEELAVPAEGEEEIPEEVVAVITAAIAAYYQKENKKCEFTVKRIKRVL